MIKYENDCVCCYTELGCLGKDCPYINVPHYYCDKCKSEEDVLYEYENLQLCACCLLETVPKIESD